MTNDKAVPDVEKLMSDKGLYLFAKKARELI